MSYADVGAPAHTMTLAAALDARVAAARVVLKARAAALAAARRAAQVQP